MRTTLKVLVSAYACEPGKGSEPGVGWNFVKHISRLHEVWVVTRANNRQVIERALETDPLPNIRWVFFDLPRWARFWKRGELGLHLYYYLWQIGAYLVAKKLHDRERFDLAHHLTFVTYWKPSFFVRLSTPFVWGPVGGGETSPKAFMRSFSTRGRIYELIRHAVRWIGEHDPWVRLTVQGAEITLATTPETELRIKSLNPRRVSVLSEVGLSQDEFCRLSRLGFRNQSPLRLLSVGRLLHWKGFHLGLAAFASVKNINHAAEYWIIGDGPELRNLERQAKNLGIEGKVRFLGSLPRDQVLERLAECDILVHPSLHDSGGWVCLEAMAAGRPVICLDLGGPNLQVTDETGFRIPARNPKGAVAGIARAIEKMAQDPELRGQMGEAAKRRVEFGFLWTQKIESIDKIYREALCQG